MQTQRAGVNRAGGNCMSGASWRKLIKQKRQTAVYRITLVVRGKTIVREFTREDEYRKWREAYEAQLRHKEVSGVEAVQASTVYR